MLFPDNIFLEGGVVEERKKIGLLFSGRKMEQTKTKSKCPFQQVISRDDYIKYYLLRWSESNGLRNKTKQNQKKRE